MTTSSYLTVLVCISVVQFTSHAQSVGGYRPEFSRRDAQAPIIHAGDPASRLDDEYIVKLRDDLTDDELAAVEDKLQQLCEERGHHVDFHNDIKTLMKGFTAKVPGDAVEILRWMDEVEFVEEDETVHLDSVPWGLDRLDQARLPLDGSYKPGTLGDGSGVNVFVIDTGILYAHTEFGGRAKYFYDDFSDGLQGNDCDGHGTHCAGTIGGETVGVAPGVQLYSCRVFDCNKRASLAGILKAMDTVASSDIKPSVVSMSLRGGRSEVMNLAVERLTSAGYIVVVAAGNDGKDAALFSPASSAEAITVGATDAADKFASYSNYGGAVDILAPGSNVYSADVTGGDAAYSSKSGTSMAAPHVAGVAALLLQENPSRTQAQIKDILLESSLKGVIDMTVLSAGTERDTTPNKLLAIPSLSVAPTPTGASLLCMNYCRYPNDGMCDDGGPGSKFNLCDLGSDCADCGPR